jgi:hypothetical protein
VYWSCPVQTLSAFTPEYLHLLCAPWLETTIPGGGAKAWQGRAINAVGEGGGRYYWKEPLSCVCTSRPLCYLPGNRCAYEGDAATAYTEGAYTDGTYPEQTAADSYDDGRLRVQTYGDEASAFTDGEGVSAFGMESVAQTAYTADEAGPSPSGDRGNGMGLGGSPAAGAAEAPGSPGAKRGKPAVVAGAGATFSSWAGSGKSKRPMAQQGRSTFGGSGSRWNPGGPAGALRIWLVSCALHT